MPRAKRQLARERRWKEEGLILPANGGGMVIVTLPGTGTGNLRLARGTRFPLRLVEYAYRWGK